VLFIQASRWATSAQTTVRNSSTARSTGWSRAIIFTDNIPGCR
jgi:hypothetical protein